MTVGWREILERVGVGALVVGALVLTLGVAWLVPEQPIVALGVAALVLVGIAALVQPVTLPLLAMPMIVVVARAAGGGVDLTVSDAMLALAFWPAVLLSPRPFSPELRSLLWLNVIYQVLTLFTLIANPFTANTVEWFHAWLLVSGALLVGWAVGASGHARLGLSLFLVACLLLAVPTIAQGLLQYASGNFSAVYPRYPWPMHKNFIGTLLVSPALILYARPSWLGWGKRWALPAFLVILGAIAVSQSRQAMVGLAVGLLVVSLRKHDERRRATIAIAAIVPIGYVILTMIRDQIASGNEHNSWFQRLEWYVDSFQIWTQSPWVGHGLRYWTQPGAPGAFQPPNAFLEVAASAGLVGLAGFVVLWVGTLVVLFRMDAAFGTLALALALSRIAVAQFDLFWVSISVSVPFLLIGVCLGVGHGHGVRGTASKQSDAVGVGG
ncbi:O-antigen ligase family protein [Ornithinimicrobium kibberense]|uniref:O-antigen ligase family protein n=2 Tax=Ornithinimicrobium kibberense TaxID=282060 RepID=A0ABV5V1Q0_9MICO|nr:O-antigen ligase family protein [Ornithinimicrobium kibberense]